MIRAGLYIRVSTDEQALHGLSLESQKEALISYAKEHNIDTIVRGVRNSSDYDYESEIALTNRILNGDLEIVFLPA